MTIKDLTLPKLPYEYNALEPVISAKIMELHLTKHQNTYLTKLMAALENNPEIKDRTLEDALMNLSTLPDNLQKPIRNMGGGFWNHSFFWPLLCKPDTSKPSENILKVITQSFGSFDSFVEKFNTAATTLFGSGWAWVIENNGKLEIVATPNQDNTLMDTSPVRGKPILGIDVWEHAYYLDYLSDRATYVTNFWKIVNWDQVEKNLLLKI